MDHVLLACIAPTRAAVSQTKRGRAKSAPDVPPSSFAALTFAALGYWRTGRQTVNVDPDRGRLSAFISPSIKRHKR